MEKVKFIKTGIGMCIFLGDCLFENDKVRAEKIIKILSLFPCSSLMMRSICFIDDDETLLKEFKALHDCEIQTLFTKKRWLSHKKYSKVQMSFSGVNIAKVIELSINKDITLDVECFDNKNSLVLQFVVNDNDGACITFNSKIFDIEAIKVNVKKILE